MQDPELSEYGFNKPWTETILAYITERKIPAEILAARKIKTQSVRYVLVDGKGISRQVEIFWATHDLRRRREITKNIGRSPLWVVRKPFRQKIPRSQNQTPQTLLANDNQRLRKLFAKMWKMPEERSYYPSACRGSLLDLGTISIHAMVDGYSRTHAQVKAKTILVSFDGFLLKKGRRWLPRKHQRCPSRKLRVEEHRLQTWSPIRNRNGQRIPIYFDQTRGLLRKWQIRLTKSTSR